MGRREITTNNLKECMSDALIELMSKKPFDKITVDEITQLAKVGRVTYFRNFEGRADLLTFKLKRLWERFAEEKHLKEKRRFAVENGAAFFEFNYVIREILQIIYNSGQQSAVIAAFTEIMGEDYGEDPAECYSARFYSYGLFGMLDEWIRRDFCETPKQMTRIFEDKIAKNNS